MYVMRWLRSDFRKNDEGITGSLVACRTAARGDKRVVVIINLLFFATHAHERAKEKRCYSIVYAICCAL